MNEQPTVGAASGTAPTAAPAAPAAPAASAPTEVVGMPSSAQPTGQPVTGTVQPSGTGGQALPPPTSAPPGSMLGMLLPLVLVLVIMIVLSSMAGRKERRKRAELMGSLASGDKVSTVGGIIGTVVEIKDDEVVVRVDEVSNTRIRFAKAAVQTILRKNDKGGTGGGGAMTEAKMAPAKAAV